MTNNKHKENWKKEYCDKFGLCTDNGKHATCQCSKELRFIKELLSSALTKQLEEIERWVGRQNGKKRTMFFNDDQIYCYNQAIIDTLSHIREQKELIKKQ